MALPTLALVLALLALGLSGLSLLYLLKRAILQGLGDWIIKHGQGDIYFHLDGYMERWWILRYRTWKWLKRWPRLGYLFRLSARLHHILRSDNDRQAHDHPWWTISIILKHGYIEWVPLKSRRGFVVGTRDRHADTEPMRAIHRLPGDIVFRRATDRHKLQMLHPDGAWSMFIMGPWVQDWGFYMPNVGKIWWRRYLNQWDTE